MTSSKKLTPLFPMSVKPVRDGVYPLKMGGDYDFQTRYSHFDGVNWNGGWSSPKVAERERHWFKNEGCQGLANWATGWRGLAKEPKPNA